MNILCIISFFVAFFISTDASIKLWHLEDEQPAAPTDVHPHGAPLNIMEFTTNQSVTVDYDTIDRIFLHPEVEDRKIVVFSIVGAYRKGKSFLMDYCLRYMYAHYKSVNFPNNTLENKSNWIGSPDAPLTGFSWKAGPHRHTSGILIWSDIFLHEENNKALAIVLMDTQGLFDTKTSPADNSRIFALGTLISSFQIFNLNDVIQENQLEYLHMATDYANFVTNRPESSAGKPFQSLMFLMRDWSSSQIFPYGMDGGSHYLDTVLQIKDYQSSELKEVRNYIRSSFEQVLCFLMPHPGLGVVDDKNYDGRFSRLGDAFKTNLKELLEWMLSSANLKIKRILGSEVTGHDFNGYFKSYLETFQSPDTPKIPSIYEAAVERQLENCVEKSFSNYKTGITEFEPNFTSTNFTHELVDIHNKLKSLVITQYKAARKMGSIEKDKQFEGILLKDIDAYYTQWNETMVSTHNKLVTVEAENKKKIQEIQEKADAEYRKEKERLEAEKTKSEKEAAERELQLQQNLDLKEEEKLKEIQKIQNEFLASQKRADEAMQKMNDEHEIQRQKIATEIKERERSTQKEIEELKMKRENENAAIQLQLRRESEERLEMRKKDDDEKEKMRRMEQERWNREDAYRKEQLLILKIRTDTESIERRRQLEVEEKRRLAEKMEREEELKIADAVRRQDIANREKERQEMILYFAEQMKSLMAMADTRMERETAARQAEEERKENERRQMQAVIDAERIKMEKWTELQRNERMEELRLQKEDDTRKAAIRDEELMVLRAQLAREVQEREQRWIRDEKRIDEERKERQEQRAFEAAQLEDERVRRQQRIEEDHRRFMETLHLQQKR